MAIALNMDMTTRRRNGKGPGNRAEVGPLEIADGTVSHADGTRGEVQDTSADAAESERPETLAFNASTGDSRGSGASSLIATNPFWSESAQDEARLAAARPDFLGSAESNQVSTPGGSIELRAGAHTRAWVDPYLMDQM